MKQEHLETTHTRGPGISDMLVENLDFLATGAIAILFVLHFTGILLPVPKGSAKAADDLREARETVTRALQVSRFDEGAVVKDATELASRSRSAWAPIGGNAPQVRDGLTWPPAYEEAIRRGESNDIVFRAPADVRGSADAGLIRLNWSLDHENNVTPSGFVVLRSEGGGEFREIGRSAADAATYEDKAVRPGMTYTYRIVAMTDDPLVRSQVSRSDPSAPAEITAASDVKLTLLDADPAKGQALIQVEKWHDGTWWSKKFSVAVGQGIGQKDEGSGVDYASGRTLKSLRAEPRSESRARAEVVFDPDGKVRLGESGPITETIEVTEDFELVIASVEGGLLPPADVTLEKR